LSDFSKKILKNQI